MVRAVPVWIAVGSGSPVALNLSRLPAPSITMPRMRLCWSTRMRIPGMRNEANPVEGLPIATPLLGIGEPLSGIISPMMSGALEVLRCPPTAAVTSEIAVSSPLYCTSRLMSAYMSTCADSPRLRSLAKSLGISSTP